MPRDHDRLAIARTLLATFVALGSLAMARAEEAVPPAAPLPLHERIDALLEAGSLGPVAPAASDAEFLRRAYLDFTGTIPDAATARAFLDDADPAKRAALVGRLLAAPRFARHMQHTLDVMWLERRRGKGIADAEWEEFLRTSIAEGKPLNQLVREILSADGGDAKLRPAVKFYLDREGEPNLVARDVGRLFFGRDLQCAQCHDHPLVDDYLQSEYYGLMAFVSRGSVFTDTKDNSKMYFAELGEGEVNFKSVFTGFSRDRVLPKLPGGAPVAEPQLAEGERYVVAPAKGARPVPKYSRRAQLAERATSGESQAFNLNLANRLWAMLFGRGIVHPLDMRHSDNPPVDGELLDLLATELVGMKYDLRGFLRELALTRAYGRSSAEPVAADYALSNEEAAARVAAWQAEADRLAGEQPKLEAVVAETDAKLSAAYETFAKAAAARDAAAKSHGEAKKAADDLSAALAAAIKDEATRADVLKSLSAAQAAAAEAAKKLPEDKAVADAAGTFKARTAEVEAALAAARTTIADTKPKLQAASLKLAEADKQLATAAADVTATTAAHETAEVAARDAIVALRNARAKANEWKVRIEDAQRATAYRQLAVATEASLASVRSADEALAALQSQAADTVTADQLAAAQTAVQAARDKAAADEAASQAAWKTLVERAAVRFTLGPFKELSPEQLAWSTMQSVGVVAAQQTAQTAEAKKQAEAAGEMTPEARSALEAARLEELVDAKLKGNIKPFVELFASQPGQAPSFQATVHQALFMANGGTLAAWLKPAGSNLTERLAKLDDPAAVADELYLSAFTRRPTADEAALVAEYWKAAEADRAAAARELVWSLVTSSEFRFNH